VADLQYFADNPSKSVDDPDAQVNVKKMNPDNK
jgi:hypothetical protein